MKNFLFPSCFIGLLTAGGTVFAATLATDNASNYGGGWSNGSNGGSGFSAWTLSAVNSTNQFSGAFIGDPTAAGVTGFGTQAFGLYANGATGVSVDASRSFTGGALSVGQKFSFQYAINWDADTGEKGFNLWTGAPGAGWLVNVKQGGFPGNILLNYAGSTGEINTNIAFGTGPMTWSFEMLSGTSLGVTATARDGSSTTAFNQTITISGAPQSFNFYASNMSPADQRQPYFNNLSLVPEPSTPLLMGLGLAGLLALRKIGKI